MTEPLRAAPASDGSAEADRDALIERLLLAGLDHYFDGRFEHAINVWTRVAFLERGHGRARAYIERARGALAERQRHSEELLERGLAAYRNGDPAAARDLLTRAVAGGGSETALVFLQRLGIAEAGLAAATPPARLPAEVSRVVKRPPAGSSSQADRTNWFATIAVSVAVAAAILLAAQPIASWLGERPGADAAISERKTDPVPVIRAADVRFDRARDLYRQGRLHDALRMLDGIDRGDPIRTDADALTAAIQSDLLATTASTSQAEAAR